MNKPKIVLIAGPTGVGKTASSVYLAEKLDTDIISCDSMQIYRGMDIGTAKVTAQEARGVVHHMTDIVEPDEIFSVAEYVERASSVVYDLNEKGKISLVVGGTGLYADSLIKGIEFEKDADADASYREEMMEVAQREGALFLHKMLEEADPESALAIHPNNVKRVIRALEYYHVTGKRISDHNRTTKEKQSPFDSLRLYFTRDRENLYKRIDLRVDMMFDDGLVEEVQKLLSAGIGEDTTAMQALGYKETASALRGEISMDEARELIKRDSRRYAKRQLTWFRRDAGGVWLNLDEFSSPCEVADKCFAIIKERNML